MQVDISEEDATQLLHKAAPTLLSYNSTHIESAVAAYFDQASQGDAVGVGRAKDGKRREEMRV